MFDDPSRLLGHDRHAPPSGHDKRAPPSGRDKDAPSDTGTTRVPFRIAQRLTSKSRPHNLGIGKGPGIESITVSLDIVN